MHAIIENSRLRTHFRQRVHQRHGNGDVLDALLQGNDGEGLGPRLLIGPPRRLAQAVYHDLQKIEHYARIARQQHVERLGTET